MLPWREAGETIALVPTMGALHAGHMALVEAARAEADRVVASIFVNPLQFGPSEDLDRYPRQEAEDAELLEEHGCDLLWLPTAEQLYPPGFATTVSVAGVSERWDGAARPGHFDGVATVVAKLFTAVRPDIGLLRGKGFPAAGGDPPDGGGPWARRSTIRGVPTVRDARRLGAVVAQCLSQPADERQRALALPQALEQAREAILGGEPVEAALGRCEAQAQRRRRSTASIISPWSIQRRSNRWMRPQARCG